MIVNYNAIKFIKNCLTSVLKQAYKDIEIIVVDNASRDGSQGLIKKEYPQVKLIQNRRNEGFCKANNTGFKFAMGDYILLLNPDVYLTPEYVSNSVKVLERNKDVGLITGKILLMKKKEGKSIVDSTGHIMRRNRIPLDRGHGEIDNGQYDRLEYVFGAKGVAPLYRRIMLEDIKIDQEYLDESFFICFEDVDLNWRAQLLGWKCIYVPDAVAFHYGGYTTPFREKEIEYHFLKNRYLLIAKNDTLQNIFRDFIPIFLKEIWLFGKIILKDRRLIKGIYIFLKLIPRTLRKRRIIQSRRVTSNRYLAQWFRY